MKFFHFILIGSLFNIFSTCAPIPIKYVVTSKNISFKNDSSLINNARQQLILKIQQDHYPNQKIQNFVSVILNNSSRDTLFPYSGYWVKIIAKTNLLDTLLLDKIFAENYKPFLLPDEKLSFKTGYWSSDFKGSSNQLMTILKKEEVKLIIHFKERKVLFVDSLILQPDIRRFKK